MLGISLSSRGAYMSFKVTTLDFYDDNGSLLREIVPDPSKIPEFVKAASAVDEDVHPELFAVVLNDGGQLLKKFPTTDSGNTWLSLAYFQETRDRLPVEAQKVAAVRLSQACDAFGIQTPDWLDAMSKGETAGGYLVDVTGKAPPVKVASAELVPVEYCITRSDGSQYFPLSDASSVATALQYFEENHRQLQPRERREYAVKVASAAARGALPLPDSVQTYAGSTLGENWEGHVLSRYKHLQDVGAPPETSARLVKIAALAPKIAPEKFASALEQFDRDTKINDLWDRWISDPWASVFEKQAKGDVPHPKSFNLPDGSYVSQEDLELLANKERGQLTVQFGHEFANAFCKDPLRIFKSLPLPQKKELARMAATRM